MKFAVVAGCLLSLAMAGCSGLPGVPPAGETYRSPQQVMDFTTLYSQNCAGCHGEQGRDQAAYPLANPLYQAWVSDATLTKVIANGEPGTQMPAFAQSAGGFLTPAQIQVLVSGMRARWRKAPAPASALPAGAPPYATALTGDPARGAKLYRTACSRCHLQKQRAITSPTYLALVDDQTLRTLIVAGRPDLGQPDWRGDIPGQALTDQNVTDIVAWFDSLRAQAPGGPAAAARQ